MPASAAIEAHGLGKDYGQLRAVDEVELRVGEGEFFGFLGPNGAGKTTTIQMLTTLLRPSRGSARVAGRDVQREPLAVRRSIGLVFQETTLDGELTAEENLRFAARLYGLSRTETRVRIDEALALFGLEDRRRARSRTLSGGMRRALDLARGILHRPAILFLDEPTLGLDPGNRHRIWEFLTTLRQSGTTLFLTTHYLDEADPCDRVAIIDGGRVIAEGAPTELKRRVGEERIELGLADGYENVAASVRRLTGLDAQRTATGLALDVESAESVFPLLLPLVGSEVQTISVRRPSLEDVFLALAGRGGDGTPR